MAFSSRISTKTLRNSQASSASFRYFKFSKLYSFQLQKLILVVRFWDCSGDHGREVMLGWTYKILRHFRIKSGQGKNIAWVVPDIRCSVVSLSVADIYLSGDHADGNGSEWRWPLRRSGNKNGKFGASRETFISEDIGACRHRRGHDGQFEVGSATLSQRRSARDRVWHDPPFWCLCWESTGDLWRLQTDSRACLLLATYRRTRHEKISIL